LLSCSHVLREPERENLDEGDPFELELAGARCKKGAVDLATVLHQAVEAVRPLAQRRKVLLGYCDLPGGVIVKGTPGFVREIVIQVLSALVQSLDGGHVGIDLVAGSLSVAVNFSLPVRDVDSLRRKDLLLGALRLAERDSIQHQLLDAGASAHLRLIFTSAPRRRALVIEDNPGAFALYHRYLEGTDWELDAVPHPRLAADMAAAVKPDAIVLDIIMPETDGWAILQALRLCPVTRTVPVIVCSVVNDRELGLSLGASEYLTKPVSRSQFIQALERAAQSRNEAGGD
jgi:CheY-like chemotaxis protein